MPARAISPALRALVAGLVDYAGLFPPAALSMADAASAYAGYLQAPEAWMLGRFVVPAGRLDELAAAAAAHRRVAPWRVAALAGDDPAGDVARIVAWNERNAGQLLADVVELKASTPDAIHRAAELVRGTMQLYAEIPIAGEPRELLAAARDAGVRAKVRTGGVTADAFPTPAGLARFIVRCAELGVPWKATAGLHHPLRAEHRLTYASDAPRGTMYGFLNVFVAAALAETGASESVVAELLQERDAAALHFGAQSMRWREHDIPLSTLERTRSALAISFGSCSFREPVDDLHQLALL